MQQRNIKRQSAAGGNKYLQFGRYPQTEAGRVEPIKWLALDVKKNQVLILAEKLLDYAPYFDYSDYDGSAGKATWEKSTLRSWLNEGFIRRAFNSEEIKRIIPVNNTNDKNPEYKVNGGRVTRDRVFLLSAQEVKAYFHMEDAMIAYTTGYSHTRRYDCDGVDSWWLRTPGDNSGKAAYVNYYGGINLQGAEVNSIDIAIRPAMWIARN